MQRFELLRFVKVVWILELVVGGSCRVTLVVDFSFLHPKIERWWGPSNDTFSFNEYPLSDENTQMWWVYSTPTCCDQMCLNFLHSRVVGRLKHLRGTHVPKSHLVRLSQYFSFVFWRMNPLLVQYGGCTAVQMVSTSGIQGYLVLKKHQMKSQWRC